MKKIFVMVLMTVMVSVALTSCDKRTPQEKIIDELEEIVTELEKSGDVTSISDSKLEKMEKEFTALMNEAEKLGEDKFTEEQQEQIKNIMMRVGNVVNKGATDNFSFDDINNSSPQEKIIAGLEKIAIELEKSGGASYISESKLEKMEKKFNALEKEAEELGEDKFTEEQQKQIRNAIMRIGKMIYKGSTDDFSFDDTDNSSSDDDIFSESDESADDTSSDDEPW